MARNGRKGGCLGCLSLLALFVTVLVVAIVFLAPVSLRNVLASYRYRLLTKLGVEQTYGQRAEQSDVGYAGSTLSDRELEVYLQLLAGVEQMSKSFEVYGASGADIDPAYKALMRDHPELFWLDGSCSYTYTPIGQVVTVTPGVTMSAEEVPVVRAAIDEVVEAFFATLPEGAGEYDIAQAAYEYVINTTDYNTEAPNNQNIQSVFLSHESVCAGYSRAYQYLLQRAGIFCAYVDGDIVETSEDHAWNLVQLEGQYAYVDCTWGDPTYTGAVEQIPQEGIIYDYFCLTTDELTRDGHLLADPDIWPHCDAKDLDYYRRSGLFFESYDNAALSEAFWRMVYENRQVLSFKFGTDEACAQAASALENGEFLYDDLMQIASQQGENGLLYGYTVSDSLRIIKLYWQ
ncbi:MAG: transglutaminase domain-containing protein [Coriobacteriales bacterium]|nr:transglutaminase domain-containing protein [Coriobacteriales bacterium]